MRFAWLSGAYATVLLASCAQLGQILSITPTFDSGVPAALQTVINNAINVDEGLFADPVTVTILFRYATTAPNNGSFVPFAPGGLAQSNTTEYSPT